MTLIEFLLARIAEDEVPEHGYWCSWNQAGDGCDCHKRRADAECKAKRRIAERYGAGLPDPHEPHDTCQDCATLYDLAAIYADHPDYREEWAV